MRKINYCLRIIIASIGLTLLIMPLLNDTIMENRSVIIDMGLGVIAIGIGLFAIINKEIKSVIKDPEPNPIQLKMKKTNINMSVMTGRKAVLVGLLFLVLGLYAFIYNLFRFIDVMREIIK